MFHHIVERLKILWSMANPDYLDFLQRQTRSISRVSGTPVTPEEYKLKQQAKPKKMATVIEMESPLDVFPTDDPDKQDGNVNNLTS